MLRLIIEAKHFGAILRNNFKRLIKYDEFQNDVKAFANKKWVPQFLSAQKKLKFVK